MRSDTPFSIPAPELSAVSHPPRALVGSNVRAFLFCTALVLVCGDARTASPQTKPAAESCADLPACIARLRAIAQARRGERFSGMGGAETALAALLQAMPDADDALVPLLADPDIGVAHLAAYALRDMPAIDPQHLPRIRAGLDRDLGWLAPALARIGTDEAAQEAVNRLLAQDNAANQEGYAVELFGARALPALLDALSCAPGCDLDARFSLLGEALNSMPEVDRAQAIPGLLTRLQAPSVSDETASGLLYLLSRVGASSRTAEPTLLALRERRPALKDAIDECLIDIAAPAAAPILSQRLGKTPSVRTIQALATLGVHGRIAVPQLTALIETQAAPWIAPDVDGMSLIMNDADDVAFTAALALGAIGDPVAAPTLAKAIDDPRDPRLNWAAATALGKLALPEYKPLLERTANDHWYPPVRAAARRALNGPPKASASPDDDAGFERIGALPGMLDDVQLDCARADVPIAQELKSKKLRAHTHAKAIAKLQYATTVTSYGPAEGTEPNRDGIIEVTPDNIVRHDRTVLHTPSVALRLADGWLVGGDRGEWGGELVWMGDDGMRQTILPKNIEDIYAFGDRVVATVGLAHLTLNEGAIYEIVRGDDGRWRARRWRALPGAPTQSWLTPDGELLVNTVWGGPLLIDTAGRMRMARCAEPELE